MIFKTIIFDLDGTLIDSIHGLALAMNNILTKYNFPIHSVEQHKSFVGNGLRNLVKNALPLNIDDKTIDICHKATQEEYKSTWNHNLQVYDGIKELLDYLQENRISFGINTNKDDGIAKTIVDICLPKRNFVDVIGNNYKKPIKPSPVGALLICEKAGVKPEECIYLGDSEVDMITGINAGMYPVGALWGFRNRSFLDSSGAQKIIKHPMELLELFKS